MSVDEVIKKTGRAFFRCHVEESVHQRALEMPAWMFDSVFRTMLTAERPAVNSEALRNLKELLSASSRDLCVANSKFGPNPSSWLLLRCGMRDVFVLLILLVTTVFRLAGPGGMRSVVAESVLISVVRKNY